MSHALIINDNMVVSRAIESRLIAFGFVSFDRTWAEHQVAAAAARRVPDLIVVGDSIAEGSPNDVAHRISVSCDAPVLMVTSGRVQLELILSDGTQVRGPIHVTCLDAVLASAGALARDHELCG